MRTYLQDLKANALALWRSLSTQFVSLLSAFGAWMAMDYAPLPEAGRVVMRQAIESSIVPLFTNHPLLTIASALVVFYLLRIHPQGGLTR